MSMKIKSRQVDGSFGARVHAPTRERTRPRESKRSNALRNLEGGSAILGGGSAESVGRPSELAVSTREMRGGLSESTRTGRRSPGHRWRRAAPALQTPAPRARSCDRQRENCGLDVVEGEAYGDNSTSGGRRSRRRTRFDDARRRSPRPTAICARPPAHTPRGLCRDRKSLHAKQENRRINPAVAR